MRSLETITRQLLTSFMPSLAAATVKQVATNSSTTLFALYSGLENCYTNTTILQQFETAYHFTPALIQFFKEYCTNIKSKVRQQN